MEKMPAMERPTFYLICDESGAKGYSDKSETGIASLGLVVGVIADAEKIAALRDSYPELQKKYFQGSTGKFHLTDLTPEIQENLRQDINQIIKKLNLDLVYSSILKEGMHQWYEKQKMFHEKRRKEAKERGFGITTSDPKENMLAKLYSDLILRCFAHKLDTERPDGHFHSTIYIDNIEHTYLKCITDLVNEVIYFSPHSKKPLQAKRYNYTTGSLETASGTIEFDINFSEACAINELNTITFDIKIDDSLALFPDVIANSLLHTAKNNLKRDAALLMNGRELIAGHPLEDRFVCTSGPNDYDIMRNLYTVRGEDELLQPE